MTSLRFHPWRRGPLELRGEDAWGSGAYGAPRGGRAHQGIDLVVTPGEEMLSPISGRVVREARPYDHDDRLSGLLILGSGPWSGYEMRMFYLGGSWGVEVEAGARLGDAQDVGVRYPDITPHVHLELRYRGTVVDPTPFLPEST